jgi:hypothetical protein
VARLLNCVFRISIGRAAISDEEYTQTFADAMIIAGGKPAG